jgi:GT2 family glycosyltransferase
MMIMLGKKTNPLVSIVVVTYNAKKYLESCLNSVLNSDYSNFGVIIVDNGSEDGSLEFLEEISKSKLNITVIRNKENLGPSVARNQGIEKAKGKYVGFLDNDTRVHPLWLKEAVKVFEANPKIGACQCKLILDDTDNIIDCVGEYLGQYGFLVNFVTPGAEKDIGQYDNFIEIFAAKSAGMIARRDVLNKIGGFDDDYFIYMEESDLCWRIWLQGYTVILIPNSIVYHKFGTSSVILPQKINYLIKFHGTKNYITSLLKNFGLWNLVKVLPLHLSLWAGMAVGYVLKGRLLWATYIVKGVLYNLVYFRRIWEKRLKVQYLTRKVPDNDIMSRIVKKTSFAYFYNKFMRSNVGRRP